MEYPPIAQPPAAEPVPSGHYQYADEASWAGAPIEPADEDLDLLAESNRRPGRLTITLLAGILAALAFAGGVVVQKHYGDSGTAAAAGPGGAAGFTRGAGGFGGAGGGFGGGAGGFGGGAGGGTGTGVGGGAGTGTGAAGGDAAGGAAAGGAGGTAAAATPAVVGTVVKVSGTTVTVKNFGGKTIKVTVPADTAITLSTALKLTGLKAGTSISIVGTTAADGSVTASSVTARK